MRWQLVVRYLVVVSNILLGASPIVCTNWPRGQPVQSRDCVMACSRMLVFLASYLHQVIALIATHFRALIYPDRTALWLAHADLGNRLSVIASSLYSNMAVNSLTNMKRRDPEIVYHVEALCFHGRLWTNLERITEREFHTVF